MSMNIYFNERLDFNSNIIRQCYDDMDESHRQAGFGNKLNSMIYVLGHLTMSRHYLCKMIDDQQDELKFMDYFGYGNRFDATVSYPSYDELKPYFEDVTSLLSSRIQDNDNFERFVETRIPSHSKRLNHVIQFLLDHELYHIGQCNLIRKLHDYQPVPFR